MNKEYIVVYNSEDANKMLEHIRAHDVIAYDTETTGLNVRKDRVIGFSVSGEVGKGFYYPLYSWNGAELQEINCKAKAVDMLMELTNKRLVMHNASYDIRITKNSMGIDLLEALHCDTILLKHTVDEDRPFGLKDIAKKIQKHIGLDINKAANEEQLKMKESIQENGGLVTKDKYELYKADVQLIGDYAAADTDLTLRVYNYYSSVLEEEGLTKFFYEDEVMPLMKEVTIPMEDKGVPVDVQALQEARKEIEEDIAKLEDKIQVMIRPHVEQFEEWYLWKEFPPRRSGDFAQYICKYAGLNLPKTKTGRYSITDSNLDAHEPSEFVEFLKGGPYLNPEDVKNIQRMMHKEKSEEKYMLNLSSKDHLKRIFFEKLGEEPITKTDKGNPQMNELFLRSVKDKYDFVPLLLDYNKLNKLNNSYIHRILERQEDGIFYPQYNQHRTISGRYGSDLQQLPRPLEPGVASEVVEKHTNKIRKFFVSGPGYVFIDADYESLEPHVFAHVSGDDGIKDIFRKGHDFYSTIAIKTEKIEGVSADKKAENFLKKIDPARRQKAKSYALGIPYGMEAFKLSKELDIPQSQAERLVNDYLAAFPKLAEWMRRSNEACMRRGVISSQAGRKRHMKLATALFYQYGEWLADSLEVWKRYGDKGREYKDMKWKRKQFKNFLNNAKNFQIQSLAASITNRACIAISRELRRAGIDGHVCAQIHDQIVVRVPEKDAARCQKFVQYLMENSYRISLPLSAPAEIARDFYEGH